MLALLHHAMLRWSSLVFAGLHFVEKCTKDLLMLFQLILATPADSCRFGGALPFLLDYTNTTDSCLVFAIELDCYYPDSKERNRPKELLLNRSTTSSSY